MELGFELGFELGGTGTGTGTDGMMIEPIVSTDSPSLVPRLSRVDSLCTRASRPDNTRDMKNLASWSLPGEYSKNRVRVVTKVKLRLKCNDIGMGKNKGRGRIRPVKTSDI